MPGAVLSTPDTFSHLICIRILLRKAVSARSNRLGSVRLSSLPEARSWAVQLPSTHRAESVLFLGLGASWVIVQRGRHFHVRVPPGLVWWYLCIKRDIEQPVYLMPSLWAPLLKAGPWMVGRPHSLESLLNLAGMILDTFLEVLFNRHDNLVW